MSIRPVLMLLLALGHVAPAQADLTLTGFSSTGVFGNVISSQEQIRIQHNQIRRDYVDRGRMLSQVFDLNKRQLAMIDHGLRQVELHDLKQLQTSSEVGAPSKTMKLNLERGGQSRPLRQWTCQAYNLDASIPTRLGNEDTLFQLKGQVWVASNVPEQAEVKHLTQLARQSDFFIGVPALVKLTPGQSQLFSELLRKLAVLGLPCAGELEASYEGSGPMANLARKLPNRFSLVFQDYSSAPLPADTFQLPSFPVRMMEFKLP